MNVTNLIIQLKSKITDNPLDQQMISKAIKLLELGAVETVTTFSQLPAASAIPGQLYYVDFDGLYWSTGEYWIPIVKTDAGVIWSWGTNNCGQLGDGTVVDKSSPVLVAGEFTDWCQVSSSYTLSLAVRTNGTAWSWGCGGGGRLGDNCTVNRSSPVSVVGGFIDWVQVFAGSQHGLGLRANGTLWSWGTNSRGQLGVDDLVNRSSPVSVVGGFTWRQVSAGAFHNLGITTNCTAWAWGYNAFGQLGNTITVSQTSPVSVVGGFTDWCQLSAGCNHSLGLRTNGTLWSWGTNTCGQLGTNNTVNRSSPVSVVGGFTDWCQVSAGRCHNLGIRNNGTIWSWGQGIFSQLGDNCTVNRSSPVSVVGGFTDWCQVSAGCAHNLGIRTNGTAWSWGTNTCGVLGNNCTVGRSSPVSIVGGFTDWCQVSAGNNHNLGLRKITL
jgi:alpha-tubulin suppressor-like RCC1 family protein